MFTAILCLCLSADPAPTYKVLSTSRLANGSTMVVVSTEKELPSGDAIKVYRELQAKYGQFTSAYFHAAGTKYAWIRTENRRGKPALRVQYKGRES